jgi:hypothetical protein
VRIALVAVVLAGCSLTMVPSPRPIASTDEESPACRSRKIPIADALIALGTTAFAVWAIAIDGERRSDVGRDVVGMSAGVALSVLPVPFAFSSVLGFLRIEECHFWQDVAVRQRAAIRTREL